KGVQVDAESWLKCSFDRKHEEWSNVADVDDGKSASNVVAEIGTFDRLVARVRDDTLPPDKNDPGQPPIRPMDKYTLTVTTVSKTGSQAPHTQQVPEFYLPQAIGHLLPRLLPLREAKTYMFATWNSDQHAVAARYVDVGRDQNVNIAGRTVRAV